VDNKIHTKADGTKSYFCPVADVFPADALSQGEEPPF
jgi:hypothetical protein